MNTIFDASRVHSGAGNDLLSPNNHIFLLHSFVEIILSRLSV